MGFWGTLGKILTGAGAVAGVPFTGGASLAALAIPAGAEIGSAIIQSRGAGKAAKTHASASLEAARIQDEAIRRAEFEQRRIHDELREQNAPYLTAGQESVSRMGGLLSQGRDWRAPSGHPTFTVPPRERGSNRLAPLMSEQAPQMVLLKAPTGQTKQVPASQAQHYIQRGATEVR